MRASTATRPAACWRPCRAGGSRSCAREHGRDDPLALFRGRAAGGWHPASGGCTACAAGVGGRGRF